MRPAREESLEAAVIGGGSPRATSCAKLGPLRAAMAGVKPANLETTCSMTSLMRNSVPSSTPLVALTKAIPLCRWGAICSKMRLPWCEGTALTTTSAFCKAEPRSLVTRTDSGTRCPGRNKTLLRLDCIDSQTSFSYAHRRRRCVPLRPKTMEIAVPQAPAPIIAMSDMNYLFLRSRGRGFNFLFAEFVFRAADQTPDVLMMLHNDKNGYKYRG